MKNKTRKNNYNPDARGRNTDCCFLVGNGTMYSCLVLKQFYNFPSRRGLCMGCPFFRTEEEYMTGLRSAPYEIEPLICAKYK
ncbi:MAG: hypothetical protein PUD92_07165 [Clostridiales bacterium]|nr:hypothetical protein [Clostridiales bacterium]